MTMSLTGSPTRPRLAIVAVMIASAAFLTSTSARAADHGPCGNFDFSAGASCKVEVSAGCTASCDAPKLTVACGGKCTATASQTCNDSCGTACIQQCNPELLDCFAGCHAECDQPTIGLCTQKHPNEDCVTQGKAQCDVHCKSSCKVPDTNCQEHCTKCCSGSCTTQVNFDCDFSCLAEVEVSCKAQCTKPSGGIFCNGQFVNATDVQQCVAYLATKLDIDVDVSAAGSAACGDDGCSADGSASVKAGGCAAAPGSNNGLAGALGLVAGLGLVAAIRARRRAQRGARAGS
jgi:hypothetical protein